MKERDCNEKCPLIGDCEDRETVQKKQAVPKRTKLFVEKMRQMCKSLDNEKETR